MELSNRIAGILGQGSDGWGVFYKARQMKAAGKDVVELTVGQHDTPTDPMILEAMFAAAKQGHVGYTEMPGLPALRDLVAKRVQSMTGVPTKRENVLITAGGQFALFAANMATLNPGDKALYIDPYYATYPSTIRAASGIPVAIKAHAENGFQPQASDFQNDISGAKSLLINSPNNPTGVVYSAKTMNDLAGLCIENDLWMISDEVYDTQVWEGEHITPRALPDMAERTLVIGSLSKSHAMTGSRLGWLIGPENVIDQLQHLATSSTYGLPGFIQQAAMTALNAGKDFEDKIAEPFRRRRDLALGLVEQSNAVSAVPAQGAMYLMLDIRATGMTGEDFANELLDKHMIAVMPGESFGAAAAGHLRVALTIDDDRLEQALKTLIAMVEEKSK